MKSLILTTIILITLKYFSIAQNPVMEQYEDSIQNQFSQLIASNNDSLKVEINKQIIILFQTCLKELNSFYYPFINLKNISKLNSADGTVRIINWNLQYQNGEYIYFGFVQHLDNSKKELTTYELSDQSAKINEPESAFLSHENWFGALYFKILTTKWDKKIYYTLLGWDGNNNFTNKKLIENFYFEDKNLIFGPPIIKMNNKIQNRLIFEYSEQAKMMLRYDEKLDLIVWDHLAPSQPNFTGQFMYYGPDMSQDGIKFIDGFWILKPNLDLRNMQKSTGKSIRKSF